MKNLRILNIPGLASSGPKHWQSIWEAKFPSIFQRVEQENWDLPDCETWVKKLNEEIDKENKPTYLVAHSLGCITVAHWAQKYNNSNIKGVLLVAPADIEKAKNLNFVSGFNPIPTKKLPFESILIASTDDSYAGIDRSEAFAEAWGSEFINIGKKGHINASSNLGFWQDGFGILTENLVNKHLAYELF